MTLFKQLILLMLFFLIISNNGYSHNGKKDITSLMETLNSTTSEKVRINTKIKLANYYIYHNLDSAEYYIDLVLKNPKTNEVLPENFYRHLLIRAWVYQGQGSLVDAKKYMEQVDMIASKSDNREAAIEVKLNLVSLSVDLQEENAIELVDDLLLSLDTTSQERYEQYSWILASQLRARIFNYQKKHIAALKEMVQLNKVSFLKNFPDNKFGILNSISLYLKEIGDLELSEKYLREAISQPGMFDFEQKFVLFNLAELFIKSNRIDSSQIYLNKTALLQPFSNWEGYNYHFIQAKIDYHHKNYSDAKKSITKAKAYCEDMQDDGNMLKVLLVESKILVKQKEWSNAQDLLKISKKIVKDKPILNTLENEMALSFLTLMIKLEKYDNTLSTEFENLYHLSQEKNQLVSNKKLKEITVEYETENLQRDKIILQREQEIAEVKNKRLLIGLAVFLLLFPFVLWFAFRENKRKRNEVQLNKKLTLQNNLIESANNLLSKKNQEILHRAKNHLTMLSVFMKQEVRRINDPQAKTALLETENRLQAISMIDRKLNANQGVDIALNEYLDELTSYIKHTYPKNGKELELKINVDPVMVNSENSVWIGLIVNELMTNSFKYAFAQTVRPEIEINISKGVDEALKMTYRDNGIGLLKKPEDSAIKSFGQRLIHNFTEQMNGHLSKENNEGLVYNFQFNVPSIIG